ncbi:MAG: UbiA family prenyltransferase [Methanoregulaceae archaeon]|jgi:4-hydroxybenzoate polyprenyltransferase|nr:UbiA family prenyltransferase [Methanoregulaceae archaeon]MCU0627988.1 UbiA family prenyltransferase [Methanoregulaceae archaeon]
MNPVLRGYTDLLRLQFFFAWPVLFCSGYLLATSAYGFFSWFDLAKVALIGFLGFEGGFVLNDYVDRNYDARDIEPEKLTKYWRTFGRRPIPDGIISPRQALCLFGLLTGATIVLIATLPYPHSAYVFLIMVYSYGVEVFYQLRKRDQHFPVAQVAGRTDFALFPVAGYLCAGIPDIHALLYFVFFYPFALAHLGANDLIDVRNDEARGMNTVTTLYGISGTVVWIAGCTGIHVVTALLFMTRLGWIARGGILLGLCLLATAAAVINKNRTPDTALKVLPLFHVTMLIYAVSIGLDSVF